jgi:hypothetical protein
MPSSALHPEALTRECQAAFDKAGIAADARMLKEAAATLKRLAPYVTQDPSHGPARASKEPECG